jgi:hypothetical protein
MEPKTKSKTVVAVLFKNSPAAQGIPYEEFQEVQFAFHFIPSNINFQTNDKQTVHVWRGQSRYTFMRVVSTDKAKTSFDVLYSGRVEQGSRRYLTPDVNSIMYVEALYQLGSITKEVFEIHRDEVQRRYAAECRREAEQEFDKMICRIGLVLNKTQQAFVAKHFSNLEVKV